MIKITFKGIDNIEYWIIFDLEDKYVQEFLDNVRVLKQNEFDYTYWTYRSVTFQADDGETKAVGIYPLAPFLAEGEETIWYNIKTEGVINKKVLSIDLLTNYRVFEYDYKQHKGTVILLPGLEDVVVNNQQRVSNTNSIGSYSRSRYNLAGFGNAKTTSMTIGDVVFIAEGKPYITFRQISDPHGLASVVKSIRNQQINMQIGGPIETNQKLTHPTEVQIDQTVEITCNQCGRNNPKGSKFCNKCGSKLQINCSNCGNISPDNSAFCNQCGCALA